jgi:hypothetical protein
VLQLVSEVARMYPTLQLVMDHLNKLNAGQEILKNDIEEKMYTGHWKTAQVPWNRK